MNRSSLLGLFLAVASVLVLYHLWTHKPATRSQRSGNNLETETHPTIPIEALTTTARQPRKSHIKDTHIHPANISDSGQAIFSSPQSPLSSSLEADTRLCGSHPCRLLLPARIGGLELLQELADLVHRLNAGAKGPYVLVLPNVSSDGREMGTCGLHAFDSVFSGGSSVGVITQLAFKEWFEGRDTRPKAQIFIIGSADESGTPDYCLDVLAPGLVFSRHRPAVSLDGLAGFRHTITHGQRGNNLDADVFVIDWVV